MGTIIVVLHIYSESILPLYQHINWSATIYQFKLIATTTDQHLVISLVKVNYTIFFWHYGNEFEHCQQMLNRLVANFNWITLDKN